MTSPSDDQKKIVYFVRTDSLHREARVSRLFHALEKNESSVEVFGIVKSRDGFLFPHREYICRADKIMRKILKVPLKLLEIQFAALIAFWKYYRGCDLLIIANHEFLLIGLIIRVTTRTAVVVDLHEHYYTWLFGIKNISRLLFLGVYSGVIFANRTRAVDFLAEHANSNKVVIIRNFPISPPGSIRAPQYTPANLFQVGMVGGDVPGRYIRESVLALDQAEFRDSIEIVTFGPPLKFDTIHIQIREHGAYRHWEILELLKSVDSSLIFYDARTSANNHLCEPNRFFEAFNSGLTIFCFEHPSLSEFYDRFCHTIDPNNFESELRAKMRKAISHKVNMLHDRNSTSMVRRRLLVFDEGVENLEFLLQFRKH